MSESCSTINSKFFCEKCNYSTSKKVVGINTLRPKNIVGKLLKMIGNVGKLLKLPKKLLKKIFM